MKLTIISVSTSVIPDLIKAQEHINKDHKDILKLNLYYASNVLSSSKLSKLKNDILNSDMVITDLMGAPEKNVKIVYESLKSFKGNIVPIGREAKDFLRLGKFTYKEMQRNKKMPQDKMNVDKMKKMMNMAEKMGKLMPSGKMKDAKNFIYIGKYWKNAGIDEMINMLYMILRDYGAYKSIPKPKEPKKIEDICVCHPNSMEYFSDYNEYIKKFGYNKNLPTVGVIYYGHSYPNRTFDCIGKITDKIKKIANVLPIAYSSVTFNNQDKLKDILQSAPKKVDLILNFKAFRLGAGPMGGNADKAVNILEEIDSPIFHPFFMSRREIEEWKKSEQGINSSEFLISIMLPELDGCIETYPIGAIKSKKINKEFDVEINELGLIEDRVEKLINRMKKWLNLQQKPNKEKKVAVICYNYPPGEDNLFGGAFLDTFVSIENILKLLKQNGYDTEDLNAEQLMKDFLDNKIVNSGRWATEESLNKMIKYDSKKYNMELQQKKYRKDIIKQWGNPPGNVMSLNKDFLIPGIINGNVFIGLQPSRGIHENSDKVYHDKTLLPHHQYIAFYKWIKEEFNADVIIHIGTHGTIEFLKGKECGMSSECFPDMLVHDIPHLYYYYIGNPAEAMIAKRRSHAVLVSYQPPSFVENELYDEYSKLEKMVEEYHESERVDPLRCKDILENIKKSAQSSNLSFNDLGELERELYRMKRSLIPKGLHAFGEGYSQKEALDFMKFVLRYDRGQVKCLRRIVCESEKKDYDKILENNEVNLLKRIDEKVEKIIIQYNKSKDLKFIQWKNKEVVSQLKKSIEYGENICKKIKENHEKQGLLKALNGQYLKANLAGDIIRSPEVLPSGYNLYQFDPRFVPTETAYERGVKIAKNTIDHYYKEHGEYPKSTAVVLWGLETSRTQGETVGQILYYLGVKTAKKSNSFDSAYEIIPIEELGRPRIDVVVNICGFFRDMFPNIMYDLNNLFERIANLNEKEDENYFKSNCNKIYNEFMKKGYSKEKAYELSHSRIFGPKEAEYGTGITKLIETKNWEKEEQIGKLFTESLKYVYSKNLRGKEIDGLYNENLKAVDIISQVRSNHEYEVTDLDHYYEFFGGLAKSVEMAKGQKAEIYISDTTGEKIETESVEKSINRGIRTRLLNPKWIDAMLEHKYHGAQKIADRFENILGLAATTNKVEDWIYDELHEKYVENEELREKMKENNPWAYYSIIERMFEYNKRGYWNANKDQIDKLTQVYLELEGNIEEDL